jgi:hypothetical protein
MPSAKVEGPESSSCASPSVEVGQEEAVVGAEARPHLRVCEARHSGGVSGFARFSATYDYQEYDYDETSG